MQNRTYQQDLSAVIDLIKEQRDELLEDYYPEEFTRGVVSQLNSIIKLMEEGLQNEGYSALALLLKDSQITRFEEVAKALKKIAAGDSAAAKVVEKRHEAVLDKERNIVITKELDAVIDQSPYADWDWSAAEGPADPVEYLKIKIGRMQKNYKDQAQLPFAVNYLEMMVRMLESYLQQGQAKEVILTHIQEMIRDTATTLAAELQYEFVAIAEHLLPTVVVKAAEAQTIPKPVEVARHDKATNHAADEKNEVGSPTVEFSPDTRTSWDDKEEELQEQRDLLRLQAEEQREAAAEEKRQQDLELQSRYATLNKAKKSKPLSRGEVPGLFFSSAVHSPTVLSPVSSARESSGSDMFFAEVDHEQSLQRALARAVKALSTTFSRPDPIAVYSSLIEISLLCRDPAELAKITRELTEKVSLKLSVQKALIANLSQNDLANLFQWPISLYNATIDPQADIAAVHDQNSPMLIKRGDGDYALHRCIAGKWETVDLDVDDATINKLNKLFVAKGPKDTTPVSINSGECDAAVREEVNVRHPFGSFVAGKAYMDARSILMGIPISKKVYSPGNDEYAGQCKAAIAHVHEKHFDNTLQPHGELALSKEWRLEV